MTFVDAFFSFALDISDLDRGVYKTLRIKIPKHPHESYQHLIARLLAFVHNYQDQLTFSQGLFEVSEPAIWLKDLLEEVLVWIEVGAVPYKKFLRAVRRHQNAKFKVYFYQVEQFLEFVKDTRAEQLIRSREVQFFLIDHAFLLEASPLLESSNKLLTTYQDNYFYLTLNGQELCTELKAILWSEFDQTLQTI